MWRQIAKKPFHAAFRPSRWRTSARGFATANETLFEGEYLSVEVTPNEVAIVRLDDKSSKVNTLSANMTQEIGSMLQTVEDTDRIKAVVMISKKPGCFIAGADIAQLQACKTEEEMKSLSLSGQQYMNRISVSPKPFIAAIDGSCLGGGLEVALACKYRIATTSKKTQLALPEVMLGLLPGAGGTQRLPRVVGLQASLDMMLTGKTIRPDKAKKMGLVHQLTDPSALESAAVQAAESMISGNMHPKKKKKSLVNRVLEDTPARAIVFNKAGEMVEKKSGGHYPAPKLILEAVQAGYEQGIKAGSKVEAENFAKLGMTSEAKALMSIFFAQTELKKNRFGKPSSPVQTIGVLGAGLMGAGIAQVSAAKGMKVLLKDRSAEASFKGQEYIRKNLDDKFKKKRMSSYDKDVALSKVYPLSDEDSVWKTHMKQADLVVEAVFEDMGLKHKVIKDIEQYTKPECVVATNTSALSVSEIASASKRPENVVGMHYFSPVPNMPLLEIIRHDKTSEEVCSKAVDVGLRQGKTCIVVKDVPGFYVNRCLGPYISETLALVQEGVDPQRLDSLVKKWGLPVGPITLADEVGVDIAAHVNETLSSALGTRMEGGNPKIFEDMIEKGFLGKKSGKGFFIQPKSKKEKKQINPEALELIKKYQSKKEDISDEDVVNRLVSRFVNEAVLCVQDEIIASPREGDIGAVFGIGFPPFLGGPFRYVDKVGSSSFTDMLSSYADKYGQQFTPCDLLQDMAKSNKTFHTA